MKTIYYISKNKKMLAMIKENLNSKWSMYRGFINGVLHYCGDYESMHHAKYKMEKDGWKEIKKIF